MDCIFCNIVSGKIQVNWVYQDNAVIAFNDYRPQAPSHILVIPRQHIATINKLNPDQEGLVGHLVMVAVIIAKEQNIAEKGYRLVMNCNQQGGQTVFHLHLHILGGRPMYWPPG